MKKKRVKILCLQTFYLQFSQNYENFVLRLSVYRFTACSCVTYEILRLSAPLFHPFIKMHGQQLLLRWMAILDLNLQKIRDLLARMPLVIVTADAGAFFVYICVTFLVTCMIKTLSLSHLT